MPATTHIEILNGQAGASATGKHVLPSTSTPARPESGAAGRYQTLRVMRCQSSGALSYIEYNPDITHEYSCSNCHVPNIL